MKNLNEAFVVSKAKDERGNVIAVIDPNKTENTKSFEFRDSFKKHGAKWDGKNKYWYWYVGKTEDQWRNVFSKFIEPALKDVHGKEGAGEDDSKAAIVASLDSLISAIEATPISSPNSEVNLSSEEQENIKTKLALFKQKLVNIEDDEDFKKAMSAITKFKNAQGYKFSFGNAILILIQNPNATIVNSKTNWDKIYNRTVKEGSRPLIVYAPEKSGGSGSYSKEKKEELTNNFLKKVGKTSNSQLTPNDKIKLQTLLRPSSYASRFVFVSVYDVAQTEQIEGKEDFIKGTDDYQKLPWSDENNISEEVRPIYTALINFAKGHGIEVDMADDLQGAKGSSSSGKISVLKNEGNDVGLTKTLAHEITHELLHQKYASSKNLELKQYFIGKDEGRAALEQQAEISAWMFMDAFGFDLKTTSLNYALIWGANKDNMVKVFDSVASVVNFMIDNVNTEIRNNKTAAGEVAVNENNPSTPMANHISGKDVADFLGVTQDYSKIQQKDAMLQEFYRRVNNKKII